MKPIHAGPGDTGQESASIEGDGTTRREFIGSLRGAAALTLASGAATAGASASAVAEVPPVLGGQLRAQQAFEVREKAALSNRLLRIPKQTANQDEQLYPSFIGNYTKGLPHNWI